MAAFVALPSELHRSVAEHLHHDSLKTFRLVCRALNDACRPEVFKHIVIYADEESFAKARAIADNDQLCNYVRTIEYSGKMVFYRPEWTEDENDWYEDGVMRGDESWLRLAPVYSDHDHHRSPMANLPPIAGDRHLSDHHLNYCNITASQGKALKGDCDFDLLKYVMSRCHKTTGLIFDAGWDHPAPYPGDPVFDATLMGRTPYGGYRRHTRQMLVLLAAAAGRLPELKSFTALGIEHSSFHHASDSRIFDAWDRIRHLTVRFRDSDPHTPPIGCHIHSWKDFRQLLDRLTDTLSSFSLTMFGPTSCIEQIFTPLFRIAAEYKNSLPTEFDLVEDIPEAAINYPALEHLYLCGPDGTADQWNHLLDGVHRRGRLKVVHLPGSAVYIGVDIDAQITTSRLGKDGCFFWHHSDAGNPRIHAHTKDHLIKLGWTIDFPRGVIECARERRIEADTGSSAYADDSDPESLDSVDWEPRELWDSDQSDDGNNESGQIEANEERLEGEDEREDRDEPEREEGPAGVVENDPGAEYPEEEEHS